MNIFAIKRELKSHGFWYTYYNLRTFWGHDRIHTMWLIWVAYWTMG